MRTVSDKLRKKTKAKLHQPQQAMQEAREMAVEDQAVEEVEHVAIELVVDVAEAPVDIIKTSTETRRCSKERPMT